MPPSPARFRPAAARLAAIAGAIALGAGAFALPAAAQAPVPANVYVENGSPIYIGDDHKVASAQVDFGEDFEPGAHTVTATFAIDAPDDEFVITLIGGPNDYCSVNEAHTVISCAKEEAEASTMFGFFYAAAEDAEPGVYDYTVTVGVDGETVMVVDDYFEFQEQPGTGGDWRPYLHTDLEFTGAEPGVALDVQPYVLQDLAIPDEAAAIAVVFNDPDEYHIGNVIKATAGYDNCFDGAGGGHGVTCLVTDFEDSPGSVFTLTGPVSYTVAADTPGPFEFCECDYSVFPIHTDVFEAEYGGVFWDEGSDNLLGLSEADSEGPFANSQSGHLRIETAENPYDLAVADANIKGDKGDEVFVSVPVTNEGPASVYGVLGYTTGSYVLLGDLPEGVEMYWLESDTGNAGEWFCVDPDYWDEMPQWDLYLADVDQSELDFACFFDKLAAGEQFDFKFHVNMIDPDSTDKGWLEVRALDDGDFPGIADADPSNNRSVLTINGNGLPQLPTTGSPLTFVFGTAAIALFAGVLLYGLTRRRRTGAAIEE